MAKNRKYSHLDDMRGRLGRLVISKNRYGSFTYELPEFVNNPTNAQLKKQILHKQVIELWQTLSPKEIQDIDRYATDPAIRSMCSPASIATGYSLLYYLNRNLQEIGEPLVKSVNNIMYGVQNIYNNRVELKAYRGKLGLRLYTGEQINANTKLIVYATDSIRGGIAKPNPSLFRKICVLDSVFKSGNYITTDYLNIFKFIDTNKMSIFFKFKTVDKRSGLATNPEINSFTLSIKGNS